MSLKKHLCNLVGNIFRGMAVILSFLIPMILMWLFLPITKKTLLIMAAVMVVIFYFIGLATRPPEYFED